MSGRGRSWQAVAVVLALVLAAPAEGHVERRSGPYRVTMGWAVEPAYSGTVNAVEVEVTGRDGAPLAVPPGALDVEVSFGSAVTTLPLVPSEARGTLRAAIEPTRPGTYAFHVSGTVRGRPLDVSATCSGATFDCVSDASAVQFPAKEPTAGQLAERVERGLPRAERATDRADTAKTLAIAAIVVAVLALAAGAAAVLRSRRD
jgi:hypothetical protein